MSKKRYEAEIEEILEKMDGYLPSRPLAQRAKGRIQVLSAGLGQLLSNLGEIIQAGHLMLLSLALLLGTHLLPLPSPWKRYLGILGLSLFFLAFGLSILERHHSRHEPRWRGRVIRYHNGGRWQSWWRRFLGRR